MPNFSGRRLYTNFFFPAYCFYTAGGDSRDAQTYSQGTAERPNPLAVQSPFRRWTNAVIHVDDPDSNRVKTP
jgi:hypothetical protein